MDCRIMWGTSTWSGCICSLPENLMAKKKKKIQEITWNHCALHTPYVCYCSKHTVAVPLCSTTNLVKTASQPLAFKASFQINLLFLFFLVEGNCDHLQRLRVSIRSHHSTKLPAPGLCLCFGRVLLAFLQPAACKFSLYIFSFSPFHFIGDLRGVTGSIF